MRSIFLFGGVLGFVLAGGSSWWADAGPDRIFLDASCGCLAGSLLFRWLWSVVLRGFSDTLAARQKANIPVEPKAKTYS